MSRLARRSALVLGLGSGVLLFGIWCDSTIAASIRKGNAVAHDASTPLAERIEREKTGRELFVRDWSKSDAKSAQGGDGLGPMYNDVSCVACHDSGGIGGGGGNNKNVRLLHLVGRNGVPLRVATPSESERNRRQQLHPDLATTTSVMLHRHATTPDDPHSASDPKYQHWLTKRLPASMIDQGSRSPNAATVFPFGLAKPSSPLETQPGTFRSEGRSMRVTERNTTSLFGAGLIDSIPDAAIVELAARQKKEHAPLITGRVSQTSSGEIGRFGWRGQMASLQEFVMTACAAEVGLTVPGHQQSRRVKLPTTAKEIQVALNGGQPNPALDLNQQQCDALTTYVASLPAPQSARAQSLEQAKSVQRGAVLFEKVGCAICHVRDVGPAAGLYSDLLLHDMGPGLSDPLPAMPELKENTTLMPGEYSGPSLSIELVKNVTTNIHQEWRTPPLWGVASSAPYLHDGRAVSLEQAIQWHGGEGQRSAEAFRALKQDERGDLVQFLDSLAAPTENIVTRFPINRLPQGGRGISANGGGFF